MIFKRQEESEKTGEGGGVPLSAEEQAQLRK